MRPDELLDKVRREVREEPVDWQARAEAAEAKLDELGRHITTWFTHHGHNPSASFGVARALAEGQRQILDRDKGSSDEKAAPSAAPAA